MYQASIIAALLIKKSIEEGKPITQMKLQKMVYFANGYYLAKYKTPLVAQKFEAWKFGPVIPQLYNEYKLYGSNPITNTDYVSGDFALSNSLIARIVDQKVNETIDYTWKATADLSAESLSNWTHKKNSPWDLAYEEQKNNYIKEDEIKKYFTKFLTVPKNE